MSETDRPTEDETGKTSERTDSTATRRAFLAHSAGAAAVVGLSNTALVGTANADSGGGGTTFAVRVENVSTPSTLETSAKGGATKQPAPLSPGAYAVHSEPGPFFTAGERARTNGLEALAEDGMPTALAESLDDRTDVSDGGAFATPVGADDPAPIGPKGAYEFSVTASPGERFSLATMFVQSNDLFYAPEERGIALFDGEEPLSGDVTDAVGLWDAGTECNEEPGVGENQAPRQSEAGAGMDEDAPVRPVTDVGDGYSYPYTSEVIRVTREVKTG
ncbi:spondin domain-containing protein [Halorussus salinisoli]|uniref:spondin domain-containing protein n=1 Tax=Halorussus salinisoli TaxID=2558242 RepID=UPI0010C1EEDD|nr:spondin domain-containing protein [Halorussus salinisoli]